MSNDKWVMVPVEPTAEMLAATSWPNCAATDYAHMLAAAPDVQGEPLAVMYADGTVLTKGECGDSFAVCCKVQTPLYAAPQPAEQNPAPDVAGLVEALRAAEAYLSDNNLNQIGSGSILHRQMQDALATHQKRETSHE